MRTKTMELIRLVIKRPDHSIYERTITIPATDTWESSGRLLADEVAGWDAGIVIGHQLIGPALINVERVIEIDRRDLTRRAKRS